MVNKLLFSFGLLMLSIFAVYKIHIITRLSFSRPIETGSNDTSTLIPSKIVIEKIKLDLPIYQTSIQNNNWSVSEEGISYLTNSSRPGNNGSIILYGHNTKSRFGPIRWLSMGDEIRIETSDSKTYMYKVTELLTVKPTQVDTLSSDKETLVLYTCTGFLDRERFIVKARPI